MRDEKKRILRNKKYFLPPTLLDMLVEACKLFFPPLPPRTKPPHQTRPKQNRLPGHFRHSRASFAELGPGSGGLAGRDSFCSICGFALDTARFGCQNPYPRAADGPGESGRTKLRK